MLPVVHRYRVDTNEMQLHEREQFKHVLFAPQKWSGYDGYVFPAVRDAIDDGDWPRAQKAIDKVVELLDKAAQSLVEGHHGAD